MKHLSGFQNIIVPFATDEIVLKHYYPEYNFQSMSKVFTGILSKYELPFELAPKELAKIPSTNTIFLGIPAQYQTLIQQLQEIGIVEMETKIEQEINYEEVSNYEQEISTLSTNSIIASDTFFQPNSSHITTLIQTLEGSQIYYSAQYLLYKNPAFLENLTDPTLCSTDHWKELVYYANDLTYDVCFDNHLTLLELANKEELKQQFRKYLENVQYPLNYLLAIKYFLHNTFTLTEKLNTHFIQPIHTLRFFKKANLIIGKHNIEEYKYINKIALENCSVSKFIETIYHPEIKPSKDFKPSFIQYSYSPKAFLKKAKKAQNWQFFHEIFEPIQSYDPDEVNYTKCFQKLLNDDQTCLENLDKIKKAVVLHKFEMLQNQIKLFIEEEEIKKTELKSIFSSYKLKEAMLKTYFDGSCFDKNNKTFLLLIKNTIPTAAELALTAYIYSQENNGKEVSITCISPLSYKTLNWKQVEKGALKALEIWLA